MTDDEREKQGAHMLDMQLRAGQMIAAYEAALKGIKR